MTTAVQTRFDQYIADYQALNRTLAGTLPGWLAQLRERAMARFTALGFPTTRRGNEKYKYTSVLPIATATFMVARGGLASGVTQSSLKALALWQEDWATLVFVDGRFTPHLSSVPSTPALHVMDLVEALKTQPQLVQAHLAKHVDVEQDPFAALNTAFLHDGAVVHVIGKDAALPVVQLLFVSTDAQQQQVSHPRALLVTGLHAKLTLVETYVSLGTHANFTNTVTEIAVGEGSTVDHYKLLLENPAGFHVGTTQVDVGKDGTYNTWSFARGTALARNDLTINLSGHGAGTRLNGLHLTRGNEHIDNAINIDHQQPYTTSWQYVKGILAEDSHAVYTGRVVIQRPAVKSLAQQADKNLLLSDNAEVDTKPSMEIWCDDVKASHGATAGQIAEAQEAMFYMQSRGIDRETASKLLVRGFANEVLQTVSLRPLHAFLEKLLDTALPEFQFQGK